MTSESTPFHVGLTADRVIDAAIELTRESHLFGWSIRDLARRLDVVPSVIYHHVGGKDRVARGVVERVLDDLVMPESDLPWQEWFRALLLPMRTTVGPFPGVAKWLLMHGPTFPSIVPVIDAGVATLQRAGFGDRTGFAYGALLNNAILTISISDDRRSHEDDGSRDHAAMMEEFRQAGADSPGVEVLAASMIRPMARGGADAEKTQADYYRFVIETTIAGLATLPGSDATR